MATQLTEMDRLKLLKKRQELENRIIALKALPIGRSNASKAFREEDLKKLAHSMVNIDVRLGRTAR